MLGAPPWCLPDLLPSFSWQCPLGRLWVQVLALEILSSSHTGLLGLCLAYSGCSINIYYKKKKKSIDGGAFPARVLPVLPPLLGGHFSLVPVSWYSIWVSSPAHSPQWPFSCASEYLLVHLMVLVTLCPELQPWMSDLPSLRRNFLRARTMSYWSWDPRSGLCRQEAFIRCWVFRQGNHSFKNVQGCQSDQLWFSLKSLSWKMIPLGEANLMVYCCIRAMPVFLSWWMEP